MAEARIARDHGALSLVEKTGLFCFARPYKAGSRQAQRAVGMELPLRPGHFRPGFSNGEIGTTAWFIPTRVR